MVYLVRYDVGRRRDRRGKRVAIVSRVNKLGQAEIWNVYNERAGVNIVGISQFC